MLKKNFEILGERMKKLAKMSLVAAVAVAGFTTTASASQNMAEWAKNTTLSGYVRYRLNNDLDDAVEDGDTTEEAKVVMKFTTPVNDAVTANLKMVSEAKTENAQTAANTNVTEGNFVVGLSGATVIAGLQTSQSPFFANNGDTRSHGVTALIPAGPVTVAAAYYTTTTVPVLINSVMAVGIIGKADMVSYQAWYASVEDGADVEAPGAVAGAQLGLVDAAAMNASVSVALDAVTVDAMYSTLTLDGDTDTGVTKLVVSGEMSGVSVAAAYAMSAEDGGRVAVDNDTDAVSDFAMDNLAMSATTDASAFYVEAGMPVAENVKVKLSYLNGTSDAHADFNEIDVCAKYQMSKNFYAKLLYVTGTDIADADFSYSQIEVKYSF
jgi:hypothetical protein